MKLYETNQNHKGILKTLLNSNLSFKKTDTVNLIDDESMYIASTDNHSYILVSNNMHEFVLPSFIELNLEDIPKEILIGGSVDVMQDNLKKTYENLIQYIPEDIPDLQEIKNQVDMFKSSSIPRTIIKLERK